MGSDVSRSAFHLLLILPLSGNVQAGEKSYSATFLLPTQGADESFALGVGSIGTVAGASISDGFFSLACVWDGGVIVDLSDGVYSYATAINVHGQISGFHNDDAVIWEPDFAMKVISFEFSVLGAVASDINDSDVAVGRYYSTQIPSTGAFLYSNEKTILISPLPAVIAEAYAINNAGHAVGNWQQSYDEPPRLLFYHDSHSEDLGYYPGSSMTLAWDINDSDIIVGQYQLNGSDRGFYYDALLSSWFDLGLPPDVSDVRANAINSDGIIVGSFTQGGEFRAMVWDAESGIRDLNKLIGEQLDWTLSSADDISDAGIIVGSGIYQGAYRGFVLTPIDSPCSGDSNSDGVVDPLDSGYVLSRFGCAVSTGDPACDAADQNSDGFVDPLDAGYVLARFGECP